MEKFNRYAQAAFLAFIGMAGLTACSSSDDPSDEPVSPSESVKTSFTLSVGLPKNGNTSAQARTRVSDEVAQADNNFRGIDNINLIPFGGSTVDGNSTRLGDSNITLPNSVNNSLTSGQLTTTGNARVYNDVSVPVNTTHFLFYGKAIDGNNAADNLEQTNEPFTYGTLTVAGLSDGNPSGISFTPTAIFSGTVESNAVATALMTYLNGIVGTTYTPADASTTTSWADYAANSANNGRALKDLYDNLIQLTSGSSVSIEDAVQDLFGSLKNLVVGSNNLTEDEGKLRDAIVSNILNSTYVTNSTAASSTTPLEFASTISNYPGDINLPDGAATLTFDNTAKTFSENFSVKTLANSNEQVAALSSYVYPSNLWYFTNSDINTSDNAMSDQYANERAWSTILDAYDEKSSSVKASTRSIAIRNQIQYAVGRLLATVNAGGTTLYDRKGTAITVGANSFPVTAILVGGQRKVDWQFTPDAADQTQYTIYDKAQTGNYAVVNNSAHNNTLVLETPENQVVNVVVELQNNSGIEFTGHDGVIPKGSKFYLVAKLDPTTIASGNNTNNLKRVFQQDYTTTAKLTIAVNDGDHTSGLGAAYNVIPDLRTPVLSIGMSVDLQWQQGLTFDVTM